MYAIVKTGGKQYRVQPEDVLKVEKLDAAVGDTVTLEEVLAVGGDKLTFGTPYVAGCTVRAEVLEQGKGEKLIIYKYKAKKDYRRKNGHRQPYTLLKITEISSGSKAGQAKKTSAKKDSAKKASDKKPSAQDKPKASLAMKKDELLAIAKDMGLEIPSKATKADILAAIESK